MTGTATSSWSDLLARLAALRTDSPEIVSCYLRLEASDRIRRRYFVALKTAIRRLEQTLEVLPLDHDQRTRIREDLDRVLELADDTANLPHAPGVAVFACAALGLFEVVPLPRVHHTRVSVDRVPHTREVVSAVEEFGRLLVAVVDRARARFFEVSAFDCEELPGTLAEAARGGKFHADRADAPGTGERTYHHRIRRELHRHFATVCRRLEELAAPRPLRGIVLAGPGTTPRELVRFLPARLRDSLLGLARLNPTEVTPAQVRAEALRLRLEHERARERTLVAEMEQGLATGWAVNGARETLRALNRGQVRTLLVRADVSGWGFRCEDSGRLVLSKAECRNEGRPLPVADLVSEAIEEALQQHVTVVVLDDPEARASVDGLAAVLRFRGGS